MSHRAPASQSSKSTGTALTPEDIGVGPLFWAARDAVVVGEAATNRIVFWNPAAERLYGYTAEEAVGQSLDMLIPAHMKDRVRALATAMMPTTVQGDLAYLPAPIEMPATHKSGAELFTEFSGSLVEVDGTVYAFALIRDCTERKHLEMERDTLLANVQETLKRAEELAELKADLSAMISHELGNPLGAIGAMIDLLDRDDISADQRAHLLSTMRTETHLLQRLVNDIQAAASMERGDFAVRLEPVKVESLLAEVAASAGVQLANHDFQVEPAPDVLVLADAERVSQVLRNLLGNAAKYTPAGTRVRLRATAADGRVRIDVEDEGPGIPADDLTHIFTKFGRGRDATGHRVPGMGLGLFLSQQIVQAHNGKLSATSEVGKGTTFSFDLVEAPQ